MFAFTRQALLQTTRKTPLFSFSSSKKVQQPLFSFSLLPREFSSRSLSLSSRSLSFFSSRSLFLSSRSFHSREIVSAVKRSSSSSFRFVSTSIQQNGAKANKPVGYWLLSCAALTFSMVIVGGLTRLTGSGLSMVEWKFSGSFPPMNAKDWEILFQKYQQFPQFQRENKDMTVEEFKRIFWWEYGHRQLGRLLGLSFLLPGFFFAATGRLRGKNLAKCSGLFLGICGQGLLGWYMVRSGLDLPEEKRAAVSHYRLTAHLGSAFLLYGGMLWVGLENLFTPQTASPALLSSLGSVRFLSKTALALLSTTILSGCLVAGLNAGVIYNTFPLMGGQWLPEDYFDPKKDFGENMLDNMSAVQFNHRWLALATVGTIIGLQMATKKVVAKKLVLPSRTRIAIKSLGHMALLQVALGISTLLLVVPVHLASTHQAGALTLWSIALWLTQELRRIR